MSLESSWRALELRIAPLERLVLAVANSLKAPKKDYAEVSFRYQAPDVRHFCLLKAARVVSALNASVHLARVGYVQEIAVLMRTVIECTTHIEYVLDLDDSAAHKVAVQVYLRAFFEDARRHPEAEMKKAWVPQGKVHETLGRTLDEIATPYGDTKERKPAATLYWNIYRVFSNYVHAKYPECMDMYGGVPGHFHLRGMSGTPKDDENIEQIASFIETASNALVILVQQLHLMDLLTNDEMLSAWYKERVGRH